MEERRAYTAIGRRFSDMVVQKKAEILSSDRAIFELDCDGNIVDYNDQFRIIAGKDYYNEHWSNIIDRNYLKHDNKFRENVEKYEDTSFTFKIIETEKWVSCRIIKVNHQKTGYIGTLIDVTNKKMILDELMALKDK